RDRAPLQGEEDAGRDRRGAGPERRGGPGVAPAGGPAAPPAVRGAPAVNSDPLPEAGQAPETAAPPEAIVGPTWDEADEAMHRLLEAAFATLEPCDDGGRARYLAPFLPGPAARPGTPARHQLSGREARR